MAARELLPGSLGHAAVELTDSTLTVSGGDSILAPNDPSIGGQLRLWLDAADTSTVVEDSAGSIQQWRDKSGNNFHADQVAAVERPTLNLMP